MFSIFCDFADVAPKNGLNRNEPEKLVKSQHDYSLLRGIPHEGPNSSFEPKSKFLWTHRDSKFLRNSQKLLQFQVLCFIDFNIRKRGHGILKFLFDEIKVSPNRNFHQDSVLYSLIHLLPMNCMHPSTMDVLELKLPLWRWWMWRNTESVEDKKKEDNDEPDSLHCTRAPRT